jgi:ABC-type polysaccharide/polyol phosphate export permease
MVSRNDPSIELTVIDANVSWRDWPKNIRESIKYRSLLYNLTKTNVKVRYRNSVLGVVWSLLNPLLMMLVFSIIFGKLMPREDIRHYPVFFLVGLLPWQFFAGGLMSGTVSATNNAHMIKKIYFPRELLPTSAMLTALVNFALAFIVLVVFLYASGIGLTIYALWVPFILITQMLLILGLGMFLSALNVFYRDVLMILDVLLLAMFFMTPIIYPLEWLGQDQTILGITFEPAVIMRWLNPMASIIDGYRTVLWGTMGSNGPVSMDPVYLVRTFITCLIIFVLGYLFFGRFQHLFAEKL